MKRNKGKFRIVVTVLLAGMLAGLLLSGCTSDTPTTTSPTGVTGNAVFTISDAAADVGAVTKAELTVESIQARTQAGAWVTVSSQSRTYDLMALRANGTAMLMAQADMAAGTYDRIRLNASQCVVTNSQGSYQCVMPSSVFEMEASFEVQTDTIASINADFLLDESLHVASDGQYVFAPVVQLEARNNAQVQIQANNQLVISGGQVATSAKFGMNIQGQMGVGLGIHMDSIIDISGSGGLSIGGNGNGGNGGM